MSLRTDFVWKDAQHSYTGHVKNTVASNALVAMTISFSGRWKAPIGYFWTAHVNRNWLALVITRSPYENSRKGTLVKTLVVDGLKANMKAASILGFDLNATNSKYYSNDPQLASKT
ncbi:THAP domain-containing protein 9 [Plakobranchus ocellatus]|uniref:THAP domain-containing protein 9 n=1 Tax=Plakobranchus ocellatus TaxID=259542 RepID=A0AAV3YAN5_9GAST|nr:THAP domain-containing protein 9 [Plakobranchus ocellatus]